MRSSPRIDCGPSPKLGDIGLELVRLGPKLAERGPNWSALGQNPTQNRPTSAKVARKPSNSGRNGRIRENMSAKIRRKVGPNRPPKSAEIVSRWVEIGPSVVGWANIGQSLPESAQVRSIRGHWPKCASVSRFPTEYWSSSATFARNGPCWPNASKGRNRRRKRSRSVEISAENGQMWPLFGRNGRAFSKWPKSSQTGPPPNNGQSAATCGPHSSYNGPGTTGHPKLDGAGNAQGKRWKPSAIAAPTRAPCKSPHTPRLRHEAHGA